jgi:hypothetical protein
MPFTNEVKYSNDVSLYTKNGYTGPFPLPKKDLLFSTGKKYYTKFSNYLLPNPLARHTLDKQIALLGAHPLIMDKLVPLIGEDILLWGSQLVRQASGKKKRFHLDAEYSAIEGASAWIAIQNVQPQQSFFLIAGSHLINASPQELSKIENLDLQDPEAVLEAALRFNPDCKLIKLAINDGEFILFHGKLWHGTMNNTALPRYAINFRYTIPSQSVRISKDGDLPKANWLKKRPTCLIVNGSDSKALNKTISVKNINKAKTLLKGYTYFLMLNAANKLLKH